MMSPFFILAQMGMMEIMEIMEKSPTGLWM
jgi:hypothetical protein